MRVFFLLIAFSFLFTLFPPKITTDSRAYAASEHKVRVIHGISHRPVSKTSRNVLHVSQKKSHFIRDHLNPGIQRSADQVKKLMKVNVKIIRPKPIKLIVSKSPQPHDIIAPEVFVADRAPALQIFNVYVAEQHTPGYRFQRYIRDNNQRYTGFKRQYEGQRYLGLFSDDYFGPRYLEGSY